MINWFYRCSILTWWAWLKTDQTGDKKYWNNSVAFTPISTFIAKPLSENHRFSLKIFKTLEGHNSLNFGRRRKFQTFLESSDKNLSKKWRFISSYLNQKNVQSWKHEKSPKTSILDKISRLGTERVNEVRWKKNLCSNVLTKFLRHLWRRKNAKKTHFCVKVGNYYLFPAPFATK